MYLCFSSWTEARHYATVNRIPVTDMLMAHDRDVFFMIETATHPIVFFRTAHLPAQEYDLQRWREVAAAARARNAANGFETEILNRD